MTRTVIYCTSLLLAAVLFSASAVQGQDRERTFRLENEQLHAALDSLMLWYGVSIVFFDDHVRDIRTSAACGSCSATEALTRLLHGTGLTWIKMGNQFVLRRHPDTPPPVFAAACGLVTDSITGTGIAGATVMLRNDGDEGSSPILTWSSTNTYGFYSLPDLVPGNYLLTIRAIGYGPVQRRVSILAENPFRADITMRQTDIALQEFTVEGHRTESAPAEGLVRGMYVRSIPSDQTQYLLDGARIYNPSHFGGVLSPFQPDVLNDVEPAVNGLPPFYGGRIGGLLDLSLREGRSESLAGAVGVGSLGMHLFVEGPITDKATFLLSGRRSFVDPLMLFLGDNNVASQSGSYELIGKANLRLSSNSRLFASGYVSGDTYGNAVDGGTQRLRNSFDWNNLSLQCRWFGISSSSLFLFGSVGYSRYALSLGHEVAGQMAASGSMASDYRIEDLSLRAHAEHFYDQNHTIRGGVELTGHGITGNIGEFSLSAAPFAMAGFSSWELAVYLQDQWRFGGSVTAELGARITSFMGSRGTRSGVDPRFSILASLDEQTRLYGSLTAISQFLHPYRNTGVFYFYPTVFWYPSDDEVKPTTALQVTAGIERDWGEEAYAASLEAYYRSTQNYHGFGLIIQSAVPASLQKSLLYGTQRAYGGSVSLRKRFGTVSGSLRYTLGWLVDAYAGIRGGESFASAFDRRHEVDLWVTWTLPEDWTLNGVCVIASEPPLTETTATADANVIGVAENVLNLPGRASASYDGRFAQDVNGSKAPGFQRLEFAVVKRASLWGVPCQFTLRMMNAYGLLDPFAWSLTPGGNPRNAWTIALKDLNLFPLYPSLGITARF